MNGSLEILQAKAPEGKKPHGLLCWNLLDPSALTVAVKIYPDFDYFKELNYDKDSPEFAEYLETFFKTAVKEKVNRNLPAYKAVRKIELRYREFDKTTTKKIKRNSADNMEK